jgi:hypothetical protein
MYVQVDVKSTQRKALRRHHTDTFLSLQKNMEKILTISTFGNIQVGFAIGDAHIDTKV